MKIDGVHWSFDLRTDEGISEYVGALGITGAKTDEVEGLIRTAGADARDETALLQKALNEAENGERTIERLVLSGHSIGDGVWGANNGYFKMDFIESALKAFPGAASQIEDFMIAGCYSNSEREVAKFREMMPNLKPAALLRRRDQGQVPGGVR